MQEMSSTGWAMSKLFVELTNEQILFPLKNNEFWSNVNVSNEGYSFLDWLKTHEYQFKIVTASFFVVPPGIEPGTQGFSVLCSTN